MVASASKTSWQRHEVLANSGHDVVGVPLGYEHIPFEAFTTSQRRRAISAYMIRSRQTSAHMTTEVDVDMFQVAKVRGMMNAPRVATE